MIAYNISPNRITGLSPFEITFGRPPPIPLPDPAAHFPTPTVEHLHDHLLALKTGLQNIKQQVRDKLEECREHIRPKYDYMHKLPKLHPRADGPFPVKCVARVWENPAVSR